MMEGGRKRGGVQRKEFKDLLASVDDRLPREVSMMARLDFAVLLVEGDGRWSIDGALLDTYGGKDWTRQAVRNLLLSVQERGIRLVHTADLNDTAATIRGLEAYSRKKSHDSLDRRAKNIGGWGVHSNRDFGLWLLQGLPGVSHTLAKNMYDYFGGVPWRWVCDEKELMKVPGIGKVRAKQMYRILKGEQDADRA